MCLRFISDLHLDEKRPATCRAFFHYLDNLPSDTEALYILGDFFEVWVGDDDDLAFNQAIVKKLQEKTSTGLPIFIMHGNRDFLMQQAFEQMTGCTLISDPFVLIYHEKPYLLMHGDSLCIDDNAYQTFRTHIRNPATQQALLQKSLAERRAIAQQLRDTSKTENSNKAMSIMDVNTGEVQRIMQQHAVSTLIHGHTHRPGIHELTNNGKRIVLGDWHNTGWEVVLDHNNITLNEFTL